jgi:hypothetical protein
MGEALWGVVAASEEIGIPCRTIGLLRPNEEKSAFQNENVVVTRASSARRESVRVRT